MKVEEGLKLLEGGRPDGMSPERLAAVIGRPLEWVLARAQSQLPAVWLREPDYEGLWIRNSDLREWFAAAGQPQALQTRTSA